MIVITGPGRSGTVGARRRSTRSSDSIRVGSGSSARAAGLEDPRFYSLNNRLAAQLGMTMLKRLPKAAAAAADDEVAFQPADWDRLDGVVAHNRRGDARAGARTRRS